MPTVLEQLQADPDFRALAPKDKEELLREFRQRDAEAATTEPTPLQGPPQAPWRLERAPAGTVDELRRRDVPYATSATPETYRPLTPGPLGEVAALQEAAPPRTAGQQVAGALVAPARGALTHTLGLPVDLLNLPASVLNLLGVPRPPVSGTGPYPMLPGGSETFERGLDALGVRQPEGALERTLHTIGGFAGPGAVARTLAEWGISADVIAKVMPYLSSGARGDVTMGAASGATQEALRAAGASPTVQAIGGAVAPLGVTGMHAATSNRIERYGRKTVARQDLAAAAAEAERARLALQGEKAPFEITQQTAADAEEAARQAKLPLTDAYQQGKTAAQDAEELARQQKVAAQGAEATALDPLAPTLKADIPTSPTPQIAGDEARVASQAALDQELAQADKPTQALVASVGQATDRAGALTKANASAQMLFDAWNTAKGKLFELSEKVTGNRPVVTMNNLVSTVREMLGETVPAGRPGPPGGAGYAQMGVGPTSKELDAVRKALGFDTVTPSQQAILEIVTPAYVAKLPPDRQAIVTEFLQNLDNPKPIPMWLARRVESGIGARLRGNMPIATGSQAMVKRMYWAANEDLRTFYAASPEGAQAGNYVERAKANFRDGLDTWNRSIMSKLLDKDPVVQAKALAPFTSSTKNVEQLLKMKATLPADTWESLGAYTLGELYKDASAGGAFDPKVMQAGIKRLEKAGKLDVIFDQATVARIKHHAQIDLAATRESLEHPLRKALAKMDPARVPDYVFAPGQPQRTDNFYQFAGPKAFDSNVKAWVGQFLDGLSPDLSPAEVQRYVRTHLDPLISSGQLDTMLEQYPGLADKVKTLLQDQRHKGQVAHGAEATAAQTAEQAKVAAITSPALRQAETDLAKAKQDVALAKNEPQALRDAQAQFDAAQETLKQARVKAGVHEQETAGDVVRKAGGWMLRRTVYEGMSTLLGVVLSGTPLSWATLGIAGTGIAATEGASALVKRWAGSDRGRLALRQGFENRYGPKALAYTAQSLGQGPAKPQYDPPEGE